jgi:subtilisin family serine protease
MLAAAALIGAMAAPARADVPAARLVPRIGHPGQAHPLADSSARLPLLAEIPAGRTAEELGLLEVAPGIGTIRLFPDQVQAFEAATGLSLQVGPPRQLLLDKSQGWTRIAALRASGAPDGSSVKDGISTPDVVVGIIDTGLDVRHADFRNADGTTRVAWLLQAGVPPRGVHDEIEEAAGCKASAQAPCAVFGKADLDEMLAKNSDQLPRDLVGHGTHVTSIAAGNGGVMHYAHAEGSIGGACLTGSVCSEGACVDVGAGRELCTQPCATAAGCPERTRCQKSGADEAKRCLPEEPRYVGMAPGATLIIAAPSTGDGFHDPDIIKAAEFIVARAEDMNLPVVINLSVGGDFGPHDGTSILEKSLAAMVGEEHPGRAIVVASGNSGALYLADNDGPLGIHTEARVSDHGTTRVPILTPKADSGQGYVWITFNPDDEVSVGLEGPGGSTWVDLVDPGEDGGYDEDGTTGAVINRLVNGKSQLTSDTNGAVVAWDGSWDSGEMAILLRGKGTAQLWVVGQGDVSAAHGGLYFRRAIKQGTINVPATHPELIGVGCTVNRVAWTPLGSTPLELSELGGEKDPTPDGICYFSSAGPLPSGWPKPDLSAPGGFVAAAMSHDADPRVAPGSMFDVSGCPDGEDCYVVDDYHAITSGSSMSSPQVAGAAALLLQRDPGLTQRRILEILQAGARYPSHPIPYDYQLGPGELDVVGAMAAMEPEDAPGGPGPDPVLSWTMLSSGYARPDPSWPVWGTVELRRADNSLASGLSDARVGLRVKNGRVVSPLAKVRHGLWRFAVAGEHGSEGETLELEVTYDGNRIGYPRALPIASDVWGAEMGFDAIGGTCAVAAARARDDRVPAAAGLLALGLCAATARRRVRRARR